MSRRLQDKKITTRLISPNYINYLFTNDRFFKIRDLLKGEKAPANTDIRPVCYQYAFIIWLSKFFSAHCFLLIHLQSWIMFSLNPPLSLLLWISLPILFLLSRFPACTAPRYAGRRLQDLWVWFWKPILILYYQVKHGVLYQNIGLLLMSFMAGLCCRRNDYQQEDEQAG